MHSISLILLAFSLHSFPDANSEGKMKQGESENHEPRERWTEVTRKSFIYSCFVLRMSGILPKKHRWKVFIIGNLETLRPWKKGIMETRKSQFSCASELGIWHRPRRKNIKERVKNRFVKGKTSEGNPRSNYDFLVLHGFGFDPQALGSLWCIKLRGNDDTDLHKFT